MSSSLPENRRDDTPSGVYYVSRTGASRLQPQQPAGLLPLLNPTKPELGADSESVADALPGLSKIPTPGAILRALKRAWLPAVAVGCVLASAATAAAWILRPDKLTSYAMLRITPNERVLQESVIRPNEDSQYVATQLALLRSPPVLKAALLDEKVRQSAAISSKADPAEWLENELRVDLIPNTGLVRVSLTSRSDGGDLPLIVNSVVNAYMAQTVKNEEAAQLEKYEKLDKAYREQKVELARMQALYNTIATEKLKGHKPELLEKKQVQILNETSSLKSQRSNIAVRQQHLELKVGVLKSQLTRTAQAGNQFVGPLETTLQESILAQELATDPQVRLLNQEIDSIQANLAEYEKNAKPDNPVLDGLREKLKTAIAARAKLVSERKEALVARNKMATRGQIEQQLGEAEIELTLLNSQKKLVEKDLAESQSELDKLGINTFDLEVRQRDIARTEQFLESIWTQSQRMLIELNASKRDRVSVFSLADEAKVLNKYGRLQETASFGLLGLMVGLLGVSIRELRQGRIHSTDDVARGLRMRVLGAVPNLPAGPIDGTGLAASPVPRQYVSGLAESVDSIRTLLMHERQGSPSTVMLVASPAPGEGKTTLAAQLAVSLARGGYPTLLIDGDLRSPRLHRLLELPLSPGLCEVIDGVMPLDDVVHATALTNLQFIPAGTLSPNTGASLAQSTLSDTLRELRSRYAFVVVDSSPLLLVPDAFMMARFVDSVILSVRPGVSNADDVYASYQRLREHKFPVAGVVMNGMKVGNKYNGSYGSEVELAVADRTEDAQP